MFASLVKTVGAFALATPLVLALGQSQAAAEEFPAENECTAPFGAVTTQPGPNSDCYGIDNGGGFPDDDFSGSGDGEWYGPKN